MNLILGLIAWLGLLMVGIGVGVAAFNVLGPFAQPFLWWLFADVPWWLFAIKWMVVGGAIGLSATCAKMALEKKEPQS